MSTTAEPNSPAKTAVEHNDMAGTSDVPTTQDPDKITDDIASNPTLDDLKKSKKTLEDELNNAEGAENDAAENGSEVPPEVDKKTMETTSTEADKLRAMMAAQSMHGMNGKLGLPLVEETIKAVMRLLKALASLITRKKSNPEFGSGEPGLVTAAENTLSKVDAAEGAVNDGLKDLKAAKQRDLDTANDLDSPSPGAPGGAGSKPR